MSSGEIKTLLDKSGIRYLSDAPMSERCTFKAGGKASVFAQPETKDELKEIIKICREADYPLYVIGSGSNILVDDSGLDAVVVCTKDLFDEIEVDGETVSCGSGVSLNALAKACLDNALTGLEFAYGIPGTVGGAVFMNAGAYGGEIKDVLDSSDCILSDGTDKTLNNKDHDFSYRHSVYEDTPGAIITRAVFRLKKGERDEIRAAMDELIAKRKSKQPLEYPSAGSTFKRPEGKFAGALIQQSGLSGCSIGGARVSEKHCGFIINTGGATATDIKELINHVRNVVKTKTGVTLETEVRLLPE